MIWEDYFLEGVDEYVMFFYVHGLWEGLWLRVFIIGRLEIVYF